VPRACVLKLASDATACWHTPAIPLSKSSLQAVDIPMLPLFSPALISIWVVVAELLQRVAAGGLQEHCSSGDSTQQQVSTTPTAHLQTLWCLDFASCWTRSLMRAHILHCQLLLMACMSWAPMDRQSSCLTSKLLQQCYICKQPHTGEDLVPLIFLNLITSRV
jgi:hypothetical protein